MKGDRPTVIQHSPGVTCRYFFKADQMRMLTAQSVLFIEIISSEWRKGEGVFPKRMNWIFPFWDQQLHSFRKGISHFETSHKKLHFLPKINPSPLRCWNLWCLTSDPIWSKGFEINSCCSSRNLTLLEFSTGNVELDLIPFSAGIESIWKFQAIPSNMVVNPTLRILLLCSFQFTRVPKEWR